MHALPLYRLYRRKGAARSGEVLDWPDMLIGTPGDILKKDDCLMVLEAAFEGKTILVYDWAGKLLKTCQLDVAITKFCVDEDEDVVYAVANIPEPTIVRFELE